MGKTFGPSEQFVASIVYNERANLLFVTGRYPDHHFLAVRPDGAGNITKTHIAWRTKKGVAYVPSPISVENYFRIVSDQGFGACFEAKTGRLHWHERMGEHHASLVSANRLVYFLSDDGVTRVVKPATEYQLVAQNELEGKFFASPAISQGQIILRGDRYLYSIGKTQPVASAATLSP